MRLTDDYYEDEKDSSKLFLYMVLFMSVVVLGVTGLVFWMNHEEKSGSNFELAKQQTAERRQAAGISEEQVPMEKSVDSLISGSTLTSDQLNIWDLSALNSVEEVETPKSTKNGTVTNQTTGETIVDGSSNNGSENSAAILAEGKTSVYDMPDKDDEEVAEEEETKEDEEDTNHDTQTLITRADGTEEWVELNENLAKNNYSKSRFVYKNPIMSYYLNGKEASWCGVDISSKQEGVDFKKLKKAGCDFVMIKVGGRGYSSGEIVLDEKLKDYMTGAKNAGLDIGVYFFSQAITEDEVEEEVETLLEAIKDYSVKYPVVIQMQEIEGDIARVDSLDMDSRTELTKLFLSEVEDAGYKPMLYGNKEWLVTKIDLEALAEYDVWLSQEADTPDYPYEFNMWQYEKTGKISGISEETGLNICFVDYAKE
ncbi:MAG: hypothetical protein IJO85_07660 [Lachnospiraceae bacterium]|nr:hypothetical protein [Lachnospiraceae bacterium]